MERVFTNGHVSIRPLALPAEHGGWGFLLEPAALALIVAPSAAGFLIAIAAVAAFLARHPLRLAAADWLRRKRYPRTRVCERLAFLYGSIAIASLGTAIFLTNIQIAIPFAIAAPLAIVQFLYDARNHGRSVWPELAGASAAGATAAAIALAGHQWTSVAVTLSILTILRAIPSIIYIRSILGREDRTTAIALHAIAVLIAILLWSQALVPLTACAAMLLLLARAFTRRVQSARQAGLRELAYGALTVVLIGLGYRI